MAGPTSFQEGMQHLYDSPKFSDVKTLVDKAPKKQKRSSELPADTRRRIHCHKVVLTAGYQKFAELFQSQPETNDAAYEVSIYDLVDVTETLAVAVLRHTYGLPAFEKEEEKPCYRASNWKKMYYAADALGIPSLRELAVARLDKALIELLIDSSTGHVAGQAQNYDFFEVADGDYSDVSQRSTFRDVILKLCCRYYTQLLICYDFRVLIERKPGLLRCMLDYVSRRGGGGIVG